MKKTILALLAAVAVLSTAQAQTGGGFAGPGPGNSATTVKEALKLRDDSWVVLQGRIVASLGDEKYTFQDASGTIMVEIDDDDWRGITVTPETNLEISGELDKEIFETPKRQS